MLLLFYCFSGCYSVFLSWNKAIHMDARIHTHMYIYVKRNHISYISCQYQLIDVPIGRIFQCHLHNSLILYDDADDDRIVSTIFNFNHSHIYRHIWTWTFNVLHCTHPHSTLYPSMLWIVIEVVHFCVCIYRNNNNNKNQQPVDNRMSFTRLHIPDWT